MRMRQIGMQQRLASAIDVLRSNPDAADELDDGTAGGPIALDVPAQLKTADGLVQVTGRVKSASKALDLRINGRWVHVDEQGRFGYRTAVRAGSQNMMLEVRDPAGARRNAELQVSSDADGWEQPAKGRRVALLLAVQEYDNSIPELETPVADAESLAAALRARYGFETQVVANPTKREMLDKLRSVIGELGENDSLTVFYAGHGYLMEQTGRGYWLPRDADTANPRNWVSNRDVARLFQRARARQILLVSDSCYSGAFVGEGAGAPVGEAAGGRAVMAFSSGGNEPVWDGGGEGHSLFAARLAQTLEQGRSAAGAELFQRVRTEVVKASPQVPEYGAMVSAGYDPGADYLLK
jgi:uncharacterized caspase-like protein